VRAELLTGAPCDGGFGLLPLARHVRARHAWWALALVRASLSAAAPPPWVRVARALVAAVLPGATPLCVFGEFVVPGGARRHLGYRGVFAGLAGAVPLSLRGLSEPLVRLLAAWHGLPRPQPAAAPLPLGPWLWHAPLWGNPLAGPVLGGVALPPEMSFPRAFALGPGLCTVGDLWTCVESGAANALPDASLGLQLVQAAMALPVAWRPHLAAAAAAPPLVGLALAAAREAAAADVLRGLVFGRGPGEGRGVPVALAAPITVRRLTAESLDPARSLRHERLAAFVREAGVPAALARPAVALAVLSAAWAVPWQNVRKEALWRAALDGLPLYGCARFATPPHTCPCGGGPVSRLHCLWECAVAQAVVATVRANVPLPPGVPLTRRALWLAEAPPGVHAGVWRVVSLAALDAMLWAWYRLGKRVRGGVAAPAVVPPAPGAPGGGAAAPPAVAAPAGGGPPGPVAPLAAPGPGGAVAAGPPPAVPPPAAAVPPPPRPFASEADVTIVACAAEEAFWARLHDFVDSRARPPRSWRRDGPLAVAHPFVRPRPDGGLAVAPRRPPPAPTWLVMAGAPLPALPTLG
jgi:hypothetical protein